MEIIYTKLIQIIFETKIKKLSINNLNLGKMFQNSKCAKIPKQLSIQSSEFLIIQLQVAL